MNDSLIAYIKKDLLDKLDNKRNMDRFQNMKTCNWTIVICIELINL